MTTIPTKLREALEEITTQRAVLDEIERQLRAMIPKLSGVPSTLGSDSIPKDRERDGIDDIVDILRLEGGPLHITQIAQRLSELSGSRVVRTRIEPGLVRHVRKVKKRRIERFGRSIYGLPEWSRELRADMTSRMGVTGGYPKTA